MDEVKCKICDLAVGKQTLLKEIEEIVDEEEKWCHLAIMRNSMGEYFLWGFDAEWGDTRIKINYCPICGRRLKDNG